MTRIRSVQAALGALALSLSGCGPDSSEVCRHQNDEVSPDERVDGARVGDLLEPYFGEYPGTLGWSAGSDTAFSLVVRYEAGEPYVLGNISQCQARDVFYDSSAHVATADGAFDNDVNLSLHRKLPNGGRGPETVASFSAIPELLWQPELGSHLGVDLHRYSSSHLEFELNWPPTAAGPRDGLLLLRGTLALAGKTEDLVEVATLSF